MNAVSSRLTQSMWSIAAPSSERRDRLQRKWESTVVPSAFPPTPTCHTIDPAQAKQPRRKCATFYGSAGQMLANGLRSKPAENA